MLTDAQIRRLIAMPKRISKKDPVRGYKDEGNHRRCNLDLAAIQPDEGSFEVFIRQHTLFIENYSIGLLYHTDEHPKGKITLVRYNGPHGEFSRSADGHYAVPHIHRITQEELAKGSMEPQENLREPTNKYATYEQALGVFFSDIGVSNYDSYFPSQLKWEFPQ